jgi:HEAT repeat protein
MVLIALILRVSTRTPEPRYKGQSLSDWLHNYDHAHTQTQEQEAKQAIREIGTNAVPFLLQYMRYAPRPWKRSITDAFAKLKDMRFVGRFIPYSMTTDAASARAETAAYAFGVLGPVAAYAYPDIARLACTATEPKVAELATMVLIMRKADATNAIGFVLSNAPPPIRTQMIGRIATQWDQQLLQAVRQALIECVRAEDEQAAQVAVSTLLTLKHSQPEATLQLFVECLTNSKPKVRAEAIICIATFQAAAKPAVPSVIPYLTDPDPTVRKEATNLLRMIAPEALTNAASK